MDTVKEIPAIRREGRLCIHQQYVRRE
jgi:hypothetical protein